MKIFLFLFMFICSVKVDAQTDSFYYYLSKYVRGTPNAQKKEQEFLRILNVHFNNDINSGIVISSGLKIVNSPMLTLHKNMLSESSIDDSKDLKYEINTSVAWVFDTGQIEVNPLAKHGFEVKKMKNSFDIDMVGFYDLKISEVNSIKPFAGEYFFNTQIKNYEINNCNRLFLRFDSNCYVEKLMIIHCDTLKQSEIGFLNAKIFTIDGSYIEGDGIKIYNGYLPDTIKFHNLRFDGPDTKIDLSNLVPKKQGKKCYVIIDNTNINNIVFNYLDYKIKWPGRVADEVKEKIYNQLLERFKKEGQIQSYDSLDIEYKEFLYTKDSTWLGNQENKLDRWWWNYGYDKKRVVFNSFWGFGWILVFNLFFFSYLFSVYQPDNFVALETKLANKYKKGSLLCRLHKIPAILAYSAYVFWGIKLEFDKVKFDRKGWLIPFAIIMTQYVLGIICLSFIANLIITK